MAEQRVVTLHLPMEIDKLGRLGMVLDEIWPGCTLRPLPSGDIEVITRHPALKADRTDVVHLPLGGTVTVVMTPASPQTPPRFCGAQFQASTCSLFTGHQGDHAAVTDDGEVTETWGNSRG